MGLVSFKLTRWLMFHDWLSEWVKKPGLEMLNKPKRGKWKMGGINASQTHLLMIPLLVYCKFKRAMLIVLPINKFGFIWLMLNSSAIGRALASLSQWKCHQDIVKPFLSSNTQSFQVATHIFVYWKLWYTDTYHQYVNNWTATNMLIVYLYNVNRAVAVLLLSSN